MLDLQILFLPRGVTVALFGQLASLFNRGKRAFRHSKKLFDCYTMRHHESWQACSPNPNPLSTGYVTAIWTQEFGNPEAPICGETVSQSRGGRKKSRMSTVGVKHLSEIYPTGTSQHGFLLSCRTTTQTLTVEYATQPLGQRYRLS